MAMAEAAPNDPQRERDFDAIVAQYEQEIYQFISHSGTDREGAADLTQETFLSAYRQYDRFQSDTKVLDWLLLIARNLCLTSIRRREQQRGS